MIDKASGNPCGHDPWVRIGDVLAVLTDPEWKWIRNTRCKYVSLNVDTRDAHCTISDRDGNNITLDELKQQ